MNFELRIGDAAEISARRVRKQKTDRQDAQLILRLIIQFQVEIFIQQAPLNYSQLQEHHRRSQKIRSLGEELDRIGTLRVVERFRKAS
jgi:hypothetical protein